MIEQLQEYGLNEKQARIYIQLLRDNMQSASALAKKTKIQRTTTYLELDLLINQGLVSYVLKDNKKYFQAANPEKLIQSMDLKKKRIEKIMPQLQGLQKSINPFNIEIYEGKEGVKTFYQDVLKNAKEEVLAFGITGKAFELLEFDFPHLAKEAKRKNMKLKYLANQSSERELKKLPKNIAEIKYLPKETTSEISTIIYGDKIAIQSLIEDNVFVIVIKDKLLNEGYKNYFNYMWLLTK